MVILWDSILYWSLAAFELILSEQQKKYYMAIGSDVLGAKLLASADSKHLLLGNIQHLLVVMAVKFAKG